MSVCVLELLLFSGLFSGREKRFFISFLAVWSLFYFLRGRFFFFGGGTLPLPPQFRGILYFFYFFVCQGAFSRVLAPFFAPLPRFLTHLYECPRFFVGFSRFLSALLFYLYEANWRSCHFWLPVLYNAPCRLGILVGAGATFTLAGVFLLA